MKEHVDLIWLATFVAIVFVALLVVAGLTFVLPFYLAIIIGVFTGLLFATKVVYDGYYPVPAKSKVVLLAFEDFYKVLGPGAHIVFPYFDIFDLEKDKDGEVKYFPIAIYPLPIFEREVVVEAAKNNESSVLTEFKDTQAYLIAKLYFYTVDVKQAYLGREDYVDDLKAWFRSLLRDYCRTRDLDEVDNEKENLGLKQIFLDKMENWDECNLKEEAENSDVEYSYIIKESGSIIIYLRDYGVWLRSFLLEDTILPHDIEEIQKKKNIAQVN
jgi:regulator of protease activity HflC (stomatin/prohibitin superfamily)